MVLAPRSHLVRCRHCRSMILNTDPKCFHCGAHRSDRGPRQDRAHLVRCRRCGSLLLDVDPACTQCGWERIGFGLLRLTHRTLRRVVFPALALAALILLVVFARAWRQQAAERQEQSVRALREGAFP